MNHSKYTSKYTVHQCIESIDLFSSTPINSSKRAEYYRGYSHGKTGSTYHTGYKSSIYTQGFCKGYKIYKLTRALKGK